MDACPYHQPQREVLTGVGPVEIPMATHLAVPAVITCRENGEATDRALSALLVTVEEVDGEGLPLRQRCHEVGTYRIIGISDSRLPVAVAPRWYVEVDGEATEFFGLDVRSVLK